MNKYSIYRKADYLGITGSILCIVHCLATPLLLLTSALRTDHTLRIGYLSLDYVFIGINCVAVYFATRHYAPPAINRALWGFLALFAIAVILEDVSDLFEYAGYAASLGLVVTHLVNIRQHHAAHH